MWTQGYLPNGLSYELHKHVGWLDLGLVYKAQTRHEEASFTA